MDLDQQIAKAHQAAEDAERQALQVEGRMRAAGITPPARRYGQPVGGVVGNLTITAQLQRRDPGLAALLGVPGDLARREAEAQAVRELEAERLRLMTEQSRQANQAAAAARYQQQLRPVPSGWRVR
jgi:hypothetical protein